MTLRYQLLAALAAVPAKARHGPRAARGDQVRREGAEVARTTASPAGAMATKKKKRAPAKTPTSIRQRATPVFVTPMAAQVANANPDARRSASAEPLRARG
jgi:hypothetical protein